RRRSADGPPSAARGWPWRVARLHVLLSGGALRAGTARGPAGASATSSLFQRIPTYSSLFFSVGGRAETSRKDGARAVPRAERSAEEADVGLLRVPLPSTR